jgi:hypothetical protein
MADAQHSIITPEHAKLLTELDTWIPDPLDGPERHVLWWAMFEVVVAAETYTQSTHTRSEQDGPWGPVYEAREAMEAKLRLLFTKIEDS